MASRKRAADRRNARASREGQGRRGVQPLSGIRVLDLSQVLAGPYCAMLLAGMGADVVKVEAPEGDLSRSMGPPYVGDSGPLFLAVNRNKRSMVLDLKQAKGREVLHRLVRQYDVLLHNFLPRAARKLRVDYETLAAVNPGLVYASVSAYGPSGPSAGRPGLDAVFQAMGGLMSLTGPAKGRAFKSAPSVVDVGTGIFTALSITAGILERRRSGKGTQVESALLDTVLALQGNLFTYGSVMGENPARVGNGSYYTITNCFDTLDGQIVISLPTARFWYRLCTALGNPRLARDPRFATNRDRIARSDQLAKTLQRAFRSKDTETWLAILRGHQVPCGPVLDYDEVPRDPQVIHNGLFRRDRYAGSAGYQVLRSPLRMNGKLMDGDRPAPRLGRHTVRVLREAGFRLHEIRELKREGVIVPRPPDVENL